MLRSRTRLVSPRQFPRNNGSPVIRQRNHRPRSAGEGVMTARTPLVVMTDCFAWHLHGRHAPWPPAGQRWPRLDRAALSAARPSGARLVATDTVRRFESDALAAAPAASPSAATFPKPFTASCKCSMPCRAELSSRGAARPSTICSGTRASSRSHGSRIGMGTSRSTVPPPRSFRARRPRYPGESNHPGVSRPGRHCRDRCRCTSASILNQGTSVGNGLAFGLFNNERKRRCMAPQRTNVKSDQMEQSTSPTNPRLDALRRAVRQRVLIPLRSHGWSAEIASEVDHHDCIEVAAKRGAVETRIAVLYSSSGISNSSYKELSNPGVDQIFLMVTLICSIPLRAEFLFSVESLDDFFAFLVDLE